MYVVFSPWRIKCVFRVERRPKRKTKRVLCLPDENLRRGEILGDRPTTGPAVRGERVVSFRVVNNLVDGGDEFGAANRRLKGRHKQTVIAAGLASSHYQA